MEEEINLKTNEEINIDLDKVIEFIKKHKSWFVYLTLSIILLLAFGSRIQNVPHLEHKYLISPDDPYLFYRLAQDVADNKFPDNDTLRYYPNGINSHDENLGTVYVAGWALKIARMFNKDINIVDIGSYYAPICLIIGLIAFFFLSKEILKDDYLALLSTSFLAFSQAIFFRTMAGFLEKEPLFLPFMVLGILFFVKAYEMNKRDWKLYLYAILGGIFTGLSMWASGLFFFTNMFISGLIIAEIVLQKLNKNKLIVFSIWFFTLVGATLLLTTKYGYNIIEILGNMQYRIPLVALFLSLIAVFIKKPKNFEKIPDGLFKLGAGIIALTIVGIIASIIIPGFLTDLISFTIERLETPIGTTRFGQSVSENQPPEFFGVRGWWGTFGISFISPVYLLTGANASLWTIGTIFLLFFIGGIIMFYREVKDLKNAKLLTIAFVIFICALVFENLSYSNRVLYNLSALFKWQWLYYLIFGSTLIYVLFKEFRNKEVLDKMNSHNILILFWFMISTIAANGAIRLFFVLAFPAAIMAAYGTKAISEVIDNKFKNNIGSLVIYGIAIFTIGFTCYNMWISSANSYPGLQSYYDALEWVRENTPKDAVFTHWWDYGYIVQTIGERATVVDPGNVYVERDHDIGGYLFNAHNNSETLMYLNAYKRPDYLFIISEDVPKFYQISRLGSLSNLTGNLKKGETLNREAYFSVFSLKDTNKGIIPNTLGAYSEFDKLYLLEAMNGWPEVLDDFTYGGAIYKGNETRIMRILLPFNSNNSGQPIAQIVNIKTGATKLFTYKCICEIGKGCYDLNSTELPSFPACALTMKGGILNIPYRTKDTLFVHLYLLDKKIPGYDLVYASPTPLDISSILGYGSNIKIYKYNYSAIEQNKGWV